jgi:hypothetical protein
MAAIGCAATLGVTAASAAAGDGYINMPRRGCPGDFTPTSATAFPGFELSDINQDGVVCRMNVSSDPRRVTVIDNTANA